VSGTACDKITGGLYRFFDGGDDVCGALQIVLSPDSGIFVLIVETAKEV